MVHAQTVQVIQKHNLGKAILMLIAKVMYALIQMPMSSHTLTLPMVHANHVPEELFQVNQIQTMDLELNAFPIPKLATSAVNIEMLMEPVKLAVTIKLSTSTRTDVLSDQTALPTNTMIHVTNAKTVLLVQPIMSTLELALLTLNQPDQHVPATNNTMLIPTNVTIA